MRTGRPDVACCLQYRLVMTTECGECGGLREHECWCSLVPYSAPEELPEAVWVAVAADGREYRFTLAPEAGQAFAERRIQSEPALVGFAEIVRVERRS